MMIEYNATVLYIYIYIKRRKLRKGKPYSETTFPRRISISWYVVDCSSATVRFFPFLLLFFIATFYLLHPLRVFKSKAPHVSSQQPISTLLDSNFIRARGWRNKKRGKGRGRKAKRKRKERTISFRFETTSRWYVLTSPSTTHARPSVAVLQPRYPSPRYTAAWPVQR